jgi:hypothetical protein
MNRLSALCSLIALLLIVAGGRATSGKPSREPCSSDPSFSQTFSQLNGANLSVVALSDDFGPTTLAASFAGSVYIFYRTVANDSNGRTQYGDWSLLQTLVASTDDSPETASFGGALALSGDVLVVGQPLFQVVSASINTHTGAVVVFRRSGAGTNYTKEAVLYQTDSLHEPQPNALFGSSISIVKNGT